MSIECKDTQKTKDKIYKIDKHFYEDVKILEELAISMGFQHEDIILFESLTKDETLQALAYGKCKNVFFNNFNNF